MATLSYTGRAYLPGSSTVADYYINLDYTVTNHYEREDTTTSQFCTRITYNSVKYRVSTGSDNSRRIVIQRASENVTRQVTFTTSWQTISLSHDVYVPETSSANTAFVDLFMSPIAGSSVTAQIQVPIGYIRMTYYSNDGSGSTKTELYASNTLIKTGGKNYFSRPGYVLDSWNYRADGTGDSYGVDTEYNSAYGKSYGSKLYAQWSRNIDSATFGDTHAIRVENQTSTAEYDEGTYLYATVPFTVKGAASADVTLTASIADQDGVYLDTFIPGSGQTYDQTTHELTEAISPGKPETEADLTGTITLRASGLGTDTTYTLTVRMAASNTSVSQADVVASKGVLVATAYFAMDLLGDGHYYNLTTDTAVDQSKTYYTRSGSGTAESPYVYAKVENPIASELAAYYEANGPRPGHGVSFGAPAKREGFNVSMPQFAYERRVYPLIELTDSSLTTDALAKAALEAITDLPRPFYAYVPAAGGFYRVS